MAVMTPDRALKIVGALTVFFFIMAIIGLFVGYPVKWIINWLFSPNLLMFIFGVSKISFWQAFWLHMICGSLFKASSSSK